MTGSTVYKILLFVMAIGLIVALGSISFGWSFMQTFEFTEAAIGNMLWGFMLALVIQFGPTVLLIFGSDTKGGTFLFIIAAIALLTLIDIGTNIGEMMSFYAANPRTPVHELLGYTLATIVVAAEEFMAFIVVKTVDIFAQILREFGHEPPQWLFSIQGGADDMSGRTAIRRGRNSAYNQAAS